MADSADGFATMSGSTPTPPLLRIPRELRDIIYRTFVEQEERPWRLKAIVQPFGSARLKTTSRIILVCRQIHDEYSDVLCKTALTSFSPIHATVCDMKFDMLMDLLGRQSEEKLRTNDRDLEISLYFNADSSATRSDLIRWLGFCRDKGVAANYKAEDGTAYVYIYDLFDVESDDVEEEKIFDFLQYWLSNRWHSIERAERERAQAKSLRRAKTAAECDYIVPPMRH